MAKTVVAFVGEVVKWFSVGSHRKKCSTADLLFCKGEPFAWKLLLLIAEFIKQGFCHACFIRISYWMGIEKWMSAGR